MPDQPTTDRQAVTDWIELLYGEADLGTDAQLVVCNLSRATRGPVPENGQRRERWGAPTWHTQLDRAIDNIVELSERPNTSAYFGVGLQDRARAETDVRALYNDRPPAEVEAKVRNTRGLRSSVSMLPGIFLDIDFGTDGHTADGYPPNEEAARELIRELPMVPSAVVHTGGGFHVWWLGNEPWVIESADERAMLADALFGWSSLAKDIAAARGWRVDSVYDLARVLRAPGTVNHKHGCLVRLDALTSHRYDPSSFEEWARPVTAGREDAARDRIDPAWCADGVTADPALLAYLLEMPAFAAVWTGQRTFQSASEADMSIAARLLRLQLAPAQVLPFLVEYRRTRFHMPPKRPGYYARTLARAHGAREEAELRAEVEAALAPAAAREATERAAEAEERAEELEALTDGVEAVLATPLERPQEAPQEPAQGDGEPGGSDDTPEGSGGQTGAPAASEAVAQPVRGPEQRAVLLRNAGAALSQGLGADAIRVDAVHVLPGSRTGQPPRVRLVLNGVGADLPCMADVSDWRPVERAVTNATGLVPIRRKNDDWRPFGSALLQARTVDESLETPGEAMAALVLESVQSQPPHWHMGDGPPPNRVALLDDGTGAVRLTTTARALATYLRDIRGENPPSVEELHDGLMEVGTACRPVYRYRTESGEERTERPRRVDITRLVLPHITVPPRPPIPGEEVPS